jgi:hypothetical protein
MNLQANFDNIYVTLLQENKKKGSDLTLFFPLYTFEMKPTKLQVLKTNDHFSCGMMFPFQIYYYNFTLNFYEPLIEEITLEANIKVKNSDKS